MKHSVQQEILLMTNSSLSKRSLCEKNHPESNKPFSNVERLENACWNGMLEEFLPGMIIKADGKTLLLWEIQNTGNCLHIQLCDWPGNIKRECSIDPYLFLEHLRYN